MSFYFTYHREKTGKTESAPISSFRGVRESLEFYAAYAQESPWERVLRSWQREENSFLCITTGIGECYADDEHKLQTRVLEKWNVMEDAGVLTPLTTQFKTVYLVHFDPLQVTAGIPYGVEEKQASLANIGEYLRNSKHSPLFVQQPFTPALYTLLREGTGKSRHLIFDFAHVVSQDNVKQEENFDTTLYRKYFTDDETQNKKEYVVRFGYMGEQKEDFVKALVTKEYLFEVAPETKKINTMFHVLHEFYKKNFWPSFSRGQDILEPIELLTKVCYNRIEGVKNFTREELALSMLSEIWKKEGIDSLENIIELHKTLLSTRENSNKTVDVKDVSPSLNQIGLLKNENNSCYLDSVLVALFYRDCEYLRTEIQEKKIDEKFVVMIKKENKQVPQNILDQISNIQQELNKIIHFIRNPKIDRGPRCVGQNFRRLLEQYEDSYSNHYKLKIEKKNWWTPGRTRPGTSTDQEPSDFTNLLFDMFRLQNNTSIETKIFYKNKHFKEIENEEDTRTYKTPATLVINFPPRDPVICSDGLLEIGNWEIGENSELKADKKRYEKGIRQAESYKAVKKSSFLHLRLQRLTSSKQKSHSPVFPSLKLVLDSGPPLLLSSFTVHTGGAGGGHYIAYIRFGRFWYKYNDLPPTFIEIGDFDKCFSTSLVQQNVTDIFYFPALNDAEIAVLDEDWKKQLTKWTQQLLERKEVIIGLGGLFKKEIELIDQQMEWVEKVNTGFG